MSITQFAMVEELAFLIKDNLPCKHLVLSIEEALVNFLQEDTSPDGVLELEPMNSYNRLLLHRLADIFGFSHQSIGEGDDRHLILERCPETAIPSILIRDLLWQYDEFQYPMSEVQLRRNKASSELEAEVPTFQSSFEEREAAYLAARERIFSIDASEREGPIKQKPRSDPVVARRMIAHALGKRMKPSNHEVCPGDAKEYVQQTDEMNNQEEEEGGTNIQSCQNVTSYFKPKINYGNLSSHSERKVHEKSTGKSSSTGGSTSGTVGSKMQLHKINLKDEHMGAARRMFVHALGFHKTRDSIRPNEVKQSRKPE